MSAASGPRDREQFRSGFVSIVGRPNVGKSTLVNRLVGSKVAIVSPRPQTTRTQVRGVRTTDASQIVLLDTPGIHKPRTLLGERTNMRATATLGEVDVVCLVVEASAPIGPGDRWVSGLVHEAETPRILVVNKVDAATSPAVADHLAMASDALGEFDAYVPLSGLTGEGVDALVLELEQRLPEGPVYYPGGVVTDQPELFLAGELVREKLLAVARDELPHSITVVAEELEPPVGTDPDADEIFRIRGGSSSNVTRRRASSSVATARCSRRRERRRASSSKRSSGRACTSRRPLPWSATGSAVRTPWTDWDSDP